jgi:AcrR family transcriptional regulator
MTDEAGAPERSEATIRQAPARPDAVLQRRGIERVQAILDAAEQILAENGYEAATLKAIGERAGIPTASVYHYFSDRYQVDAALVQRHIQALDTRIRAALNDKTPVDSLRDAVDAVIDPVLDYFRAHPSAVELWFALRNEQFAGLVQSFDDATAEQLWRLALDRGLLRADTPLLVMQVVFAAGNTLLDVAFRRTPITGDDATIEEARRLASSYLESYAA